MFLDRIRLQNTRSIEDMELTFSVANDGKKWCLLLGENGTGKSTVLRAIALVTAGSEALLHLLKNPGSWVRHGAEEAVIDATLSTAAGETREVRLVLRREHNVSQVLRHNTEGLRELDEALDKATQNYFTIGYGASRRLAPSSLSREESGVGHRARSVLTLFDREARLNSLESWALDLDYAAKSGENADASLAVLALVKDTLNDLLEGVSFAGIAVDSRELLFETEHGTVPLEQLSDGFQNMAGWLGDLLYRVNRAFDHHQTPTHARGLLLVDELGLHLHPTLQRRLLAKVRSTFTQLQVIGTSHSPLIAGALHQQELRVVHKVGQTVVATPPDREVYGLSADQVLASPLFGMETSRVAAFDEQLETVRKQASQGDVKAAHTLSRMLALGADWNTSEAP